MTVRSSPFRSTLAPSIRLPYHHASPKAGTLPSVPSPRRLDRPSSVVRRPQGLLREHDGLGFRSSAEADWPQDDVDAMS